MVRWCLYLKCLVICATSTLNLEQSYSDFKLCSLDVSKVAHCNIMHYVCKSLKYDLTDAYILHRCISILYQSQRYMYTLSMCNNSILIGSGSFSYRFPLSCTIKYCLNAIFKITKFTYTMYFNAAISGHTVKTCRKLNNDLTNYY